MLYKRGKTWWVRFTWRGQELRRSTRTANRKDAEDFEARLRSELWNQAEMGGKPRRSWPEAVVRYVPEVQARRSFGEIRRHLRHLDGWLSGRYLDEIDREMVETVKAERLAQGVAPATVNRTLAVLARVMHRAQAWGWVSMAPMVEMLPEDNRRLRWLTREEADRLLDELPAHLAAMARFTLATGLRERNVVELDWQQIDLKRRVAWVSADQAKGKRGISVPLNRDAVVVLRQQAGGEPPESGRVFTYRGKPISRAGGRAWQAALRRAGIEDFRWHDLRHTWASWHAQGGTPLHVLRDLGGWRSMQMVERYAHLAQSHLAEHAETVASLHRTKSGTAAKTAS